MRLVHAAAVLSGLALTSSGGALAGAPGASSPPPGAVPSADVRVDVHDFGEFRIRLDPTGAPNAVAAFLTLAAGGAFDGLTFHRIIPDLLIQTGNPATREGAPSDVPPAPPWRLPAELSPRSHRRGTVSLAWRDSDPGSAGMQWFVTLSDLPALDGRATPIGEVVEGMEVVDHIAQVSTFRNLAPVRRIVITKVTVEPPAVTMAPPSAAPAPPPAAAADSQAAPPIAARDSAATPDSTVAGDGKRPETRGA